jgi:hypothetical protein
MRKQTTMPAKVRRQLWKILEYLADDERRHWEECCEAEDGKCTNHIWHSCRKVITWLDASEPAKQTGMRN